MSTENQIAQLLADDAPPARDFAFEIAVAKRIERRRLIRELALIICGGVGSAVVLAQVMPFLEASWASYFSGSGIVVAISILIAGGVLALQPTWERA